MISRFTLLPYQCSARRFFSVSSRMSALNSKGKALVFPGQGAQHPGMAKNLASSFKSARQILQRVDEALSYPLSKLMFEGPMEELTRTDNAQPALVAHSMAVLAVLEEQKDFVIERDIDLVMGHSLGEFSALCAAKAFTLEDTVNLVRIREQAHKFAEIARQKTGLVCDVANINGPKQVVLSGHTKALEYALHVAQQDGLRLKSLNLNVGAPFHSALMEPAAHALAEALGKITDRVKNPLVPIILNTSAEMEHDIEVIVPVLIKQTTSPVQWYNCVLEAQKHGVTQFIEVGPKRTLSNLISHVDKACSTLGLGEPEDIDKFQQKNNKF